MNDVIAPASVKELLEFVAATSPVLPVGNQTKPALAAAGGATPVSLRSLSGLIEYEPSEFTFTAWAGTPVAEVAEVLAAKNQYLPFDPPRIAAGCTLGGVVGAGIAGPGRVRYGGIRDFLLGARVVSGEGEVLTVGGKVVKNAAGFDIPKLLVGSLGRLGIMTELTFKVFPAPSAVSTLRVRCVSHDQAIERIAAAARARWEVDALEYVPRDNAVYLRLAGPEPVLEALAQDVMATWSGDVERLDPDEAQRFWDTLADWGQLPRGSVLVKVPTTLAQYQALQLACSEKVGIELRLGGAGTVTWITVNSAGANDESLLSDLHRELVNQSLPGMIVHHSHDHESADQVSCVVDNIFLGHPRQDRLGALIKQAMDPSGTFPWFSDAATD